jgi:homoserine dehydrogenase
MGHTIKLLGTSYIKDDKVSVMVAPFLVNKTSPLYGVNDVFNAVLVKGNMLGDTMFYGAGAGKLPTASAVVADIIDIACNIDRNIAIKWTDDKMSLNSFEEMTNDFFVRVVNDDAQEHVRNAFEDVEEINIGKTNEYAFVVRNISEGNFKELISKVDNVISVIRIKK